MGLNKTESDMSRMTSTQFGASNTEGLKGEINKSLKGTTITTDESGRKYTLYTFRWLIQSLFACSMMVTGLMMVGFSPVS
jgi:hypothetical protein